MIVAYGGCALPCNQRLSRCDGDNWYGPRVPTMLDHHSPSGRELQNTIAWWKVSRAVRSSRAVIFPSMSGSPVRSSARDQGMWSLG